MKKISLLFSIFLLCTGCPEEISDILEIPKEQGRSLKVTVKSCNLTADPNCDNLIFLSEAKVAAFESKADRDANVNGREKLTNALGETTFDELQTDSIFLKASWEGAVHFDEVATPDKMETELFIIIVL